MKRYALKPPSAMPPCAFAGIVSTSLGDPNPGGSVEIGDSISMGTHYFADGWAIAERVALPEPNKATVIASGSDAAIWNGLPVGASVVVTGPISGSVIVDSSGVFALDVDFPGVYVVRITCEPTHIAAEWRIIAT